MEKILVVYYSFSGTTRVLAEKKASDLGADLCEVKERKKRSVPGAYVLGSFAAMRKKCSEIEPLDRNLADYDRIVMMAPIWAGSPAPAFNSVVAMLPEGKEVELILTSGSGNSRGSTQKTKELIEAKQCRVVKYEDVRTTK